MARPVFHSLLLLLLPCRRTYASSYTAVHTTRIHKTGLSWLFSCMISSHLGWTPVYRPPTAFDVFTAVNTEFVFSYTNDINHFPSLLSLLFLSVHRGGWLPLHSSTCHFTPETIALHSYVLLCEKKTVRQESNRRLRASRWFRLSLIRQAALPAEPTVPVVRKTDKTTRHQPSSTRDLGKCFWFSC